MKIRIELEKAKSDFVILKAKTDTDKYQLKLTSLCLNIPIGQASSQVYNELNHLLTKGNPPKPLSFHYRKIEVRAIPITKGSNTFLTDNIFPDNVLPSRIVLAFVETAAYRGDDTKNPFEFNRQWYTTADVDSKSSGKEENLSEMKQYFQSLEKKFSNFMELMAAEIKKGKKTNREEPTQESSQPLSDSESVEHSLDCLDEDFRSAGAGFSRASSNVSENIRDPKPVSDPAPTPNLKKVYIQKIDCNLTNLPIDQLDSTATDSDDRAMYFRMYYANGQLNSLFSNGITYTDFMQGKKKTLFYSLV